MSDKRIYDIVEEKGSVTHKWAIELSEDEFKTLQKILERMSEPPYFTDVRQVYVKGN